MDQINARLEETLIQIRLAATVAEKANTVDENTTLLGNTSDVPVARDDDTISLTDSAIDVRTNPSHSRSGSSAGRLSTDLTVPLLREKKLSTLLGASSGHGIHSD